MASLARALSIKVKVGGRAGPGQPHQAQTNQWPALSTHTHTQSNTNKNSCEGAVSKVCPIAASLGVRGPADRSELCASV